MNILENLLYTKSHEWVKKIDENTALVGLTDFAQEALGDLVFINLPEVDQEVIAGEMFSDVESVKAVSDVYSPVSGTVEEINEELLDVPEKINQEPYEAWIAKINNIQEFNSLLNKQEYQDFCSKEA